LYPQADLVTESQNHAIAVFMQYRLGAFGFLAGPSVKRSGALNAGLLDQHFALQWVQQYISLFGGDPSKVTIWGESAGAGSVLQHVVAHGGRTNPPLFRAAITSSTFLPPQYAADDLIPTLLYDQIANFTNCDDAADTFACLVAVDSDTLNNANDAIASSAFYGTYVFVPVVDGSFIIERPTITMGRQVVNGDVLLSVTNTFEGRIFTLPSETNTTDFVRQMFPFLSAKQIDTAASYYTALNTTIPTTLNQSVAIMDLGRENSPSLQVTTMKTSHFISR
jgi:carboxylesterase type B